MALLISASRHMTCFSGTTVTSGNPEQHIPLPALEITEKANPALSRNDMKKKRLVKRIISRRDSMFDAYHVDPVLENRTVCSHSHEQVPKILVECLLKCADLMIQKEVVQHNILDNSVIPLTAVAGPEKRTKTTAENRDTCLDILSSLVFSCEDLLSTATVAELESISRLANFCVNTLAEHPAKLPIEERDGSEESVRSHLHVPVHSVDSPIRISVVVDV